MKDLPPHNSKISCGHTPHRRAGEPCFGLCASPCRARKSRRTRLPLRGFWVKQKPSTALLKRSKTFNIKGMHLSLRAPVLLLAGFLIFGGVPYALAQETPPSDVPEETPAQKAIREANEEAAKARADAEAAAQAQIDATNSEIQRLKNEIAELQKNLNLTTAQKQTLQSAIKALDLQIQKLQKSVTLTSSQISVKDKEIGNLSGKIRTTEEKISDAKVAVASTLRQLERMDQEYLVTTLLGWGTLSSFFDQAVTVGSLRGELQNKMQDLGSLRTNLETSKTSAETKRKELASLKTNLNQQKQGVTAT